MDENSEGRVERREENRTEHVVFLRDLTHVEAFWSFHLGISKTVWVKSRIRLQLSLKWSPWWWFK